MFEVQEKWQEFSNELEDFLAASDSRFIERVRQARQEHLNGQVRDFNELKNELLE